MVDPIRELKSFGRDIASLAIARVPQNLDKAALLCVNTPTSFRKNLGKTPINDAVAVAKSLKEYGFDIFFICNPHARNFLKYLDALLRGTSGQLVVFYVGHAMATSDFEPGELQDKAFIFDDGAILDDEVVTHLIDNKNSSSEVILITDACLPGSIWDIQDGVVKGRELPPGVMSISAVSDGPSAKQRAVQPLEQSVFTSSLVKLLESEAALELTPEGLARELKPVLAKYSQTLSIGTSTQSLLSRSLVV
jgi:hypothetical protein